MKAKEFIRRLKSQIEMAGGGPNTEVNVFNSSGELDEPIVYCIMNFRTKELKRVDIGAAGDE